MLSAELNRHRRLGVEFEMAVPLIGGGVAQDLRQTMARILTENGLPAQARSYCHAAVPQGCDVVIESDGSIVGENQYRGIEWVPVEAKTRILSGVEDYDRVVGKLLEICRYVGARVNASTGHHVHVEFTEARDDPSVIRSFYNIAHRVEPVVFGLVSPSRRTNRFCCPLPDQTRLLHRCRRLEDYERVLTQAGLQRYWAINMTHLFSNAPRVEFRHHQGTLDFEKAKHWRNLVLRLIDHSIQRTCKATKVQLVNNEESLMRTLVTLGFKPNTRVFGTVDPELRATGRFLLKRWKHFNQQSPPAAPPRPASTETEDDGGLPRFGAVRFPPPAQ